MKRDTFEEKNNNLEWLTLCSMQTKKDGSLNLGNLTDQLKLHLNKKEDFVLYLEYSPIREDYTFGIYKEKKE